MIIMTTLMITTLIMIKKITLILITMFRLIMITTVTISSKRHRKYRKNTRRKRQDGLFSFDNLVIMITINDNADNNNNIGHIIDCKKNNINDKENNIVNVNDNLNIDCNNENIAYVRLHKCISPTPSTDLQNDSVCHHPFNTYENEGF